MIFDIGNELKLGIEVLEHGIFHLRCEGYDGAQETLLDRYRIIQPLAKETDFELTERTFSLKDGITLRIGEGQGFQLLKDGEVVAETASGTKFATAPTVYGNQGYRLEMKIGKEEKLIGFGDQVRTRLLLNGQRDELYLKYPVKHVPVPFYMSSKGYGIFFNTTRKLHYDVAVASPDRGCFVVEKEFLNIYLITGGSYDEMIDRYTRLTGRPGLPPMKSFGLWLLFHTRATGHDVLMIADAMREKNIPCDNLSLEPNWMQVYYDATVNKEWNAERFRGCEDGGSWRGGPGSLIKALKRMGYELGVWLCTRWDFTHEEERKIGAGGGNETPDLLLDGIELTHDDANVGHSPIYMDENTVRDQAWFEHLKKFVDDGVRFFKLDPAWLINEFPDRLYGNGRTDEEMHNLAFLLASRQMAEGYEAHTGRRYYGISVAGWAGLQSYPGTWAGDTGGGIQSMTGLLQDAIVGHSYTTCDMNAESIEGIHMGFMLPWALLNTWAGFKYPGFLGKTLNEAFQFYSAFRMKLIPYYYSLAYRASRNGRAILRPLCLEYPDEAWAYEERNVFLLGDSILVSVYSDSNIRLPRGRWYDYWSGRTYEGDGSPQAIGFPENRGGHLFIREGALIPTQPARLYVDAGAIEEINWIVLPSEKESSFTLYLDDGDTVANRNGQFGAVTLYWQNGEIKWSEISGNAPEFITRLAHNFILPDGTRLNIAPIPTGVPISLAL